MIPFVVVPLALAAGQVPESPTLVGQEVAHATTTAGGTVFLELTSPSDGQTVLPGDRIDWVVTASVSNDNLGLALLSVDILHDRSNPSFFDLDPGVGSSAVMRAFDRPRGFANPGITPRVSGYGGTPVGEPGRRDLAQIGGAQNTFGVSGPCLGPIGEICYGQDVIVRTGVGQGPNAQRIAIGNFDAPQTPGTYRFELRNAKATVLEAVNAPPQASVVEPAATVPTIRAFTFTVL